MEPVAGGEGVGDGLLGLLGGDLEDAEAEDRHLDAVVEGDGLHGVLRAVPSVGSGGDDDLGGPRGRPSPGSRRARRGVPGPLSTQRRPAASQS